MIDRRRIETASVRPPETAARRYHSELRKCEACGQRKPPAAFSSRATVVCRRCVLQRG